MLLIGVTLLLLATWYAFVTALDGGPLAMRAVLAATGCTGQIVLTCTLLGAVGLLTRGAVLGVNLAVAAALVAAALRVLGDARRSPGSPPGNRPLDFSADLRTFVRGIAAALRWETAVLMLVLLFAAAWLATAVAWYPPRGIDDLVYHLPLVFQAIQDHRITVLPLELRSFFAFPLAGEMTFLWDVLIDGSIRWVDGVQAVFALFGMAAVFAIGRRFGLSRRGALFAAGIFGAMPVVLLQATSNYVDIISNVWLLAAAAALLRYEESGSRAALALGGLAAGLHLGTKYQALLTTLALGAMAAILIRERSRPLERSQGAPGRTAREAASRGTSSGGGAGQQASPARGRETSVIAASRQQGPERPVVAALLFSLPALAACGYWYLRNWVRFGSPFYPLPIQILGLEIFSGPFRQGSSTWSALVSDPIELARIAVWDPGLGSFHGGFGFLFWGFAAPAGGWALAAVLRDRNEARAGRLFTLGLLPVGLATLFVAPHDQLLRTPRYVLAIGGVAAVALALLVEEAARRAIGAASLVRAGAAIAACLALPVAAPAVWPLVSLAPVADDPPETRAAGELRYLENAGWDLRTMASAWGPLDAATRGGAGLSVYESSEYSVFWTGPTYGVDLQNRIWNFDPNPPEKPDAFFFHAPRGSPFYLGTTIERTTVAADPAYRLVASQGEDATTLYLSIDALASHDRQARLADYYRRTAHEMVELTAPSASSMEPGSVVLAPFPFAAGYLVHRADGKLRAEVDPVPTRDLQAAAARWPHHVLYSFGVPVPGAAAARAAGELSYRGGKLTIIRNEPAR